ncbi:PaaI family thioesterase [Pseudohongiella sp.]|uniref:Thioesterase domain-containing protein n=1 Tax=marine sediment metagenome TaxID=412755 RepID=A0A0F9W6F1_9ZZZZ|nr:PaaI family thioesterase [Pseudohongiella sp.]HDZ08080.1 PaaI family thioesterase [Pseudohongiella sp.]HEA63048.1 PaaI family thioesterase [Pseudohongiella sp.]
MSADEQQPIFMRPGHCAGDLLEAPDWRIIREAEGLIDIDAHIPGKVLNPRQQLFGGFTGTYVDMVALYTIRTLFPRREDYWITTINMRIDYLDPVLGPRVRLQGELINKGRSTSLVSVTFFDEDDNKLVYALVTLRVIDRQQA